MDENDVVARRVDGGGVRKNPPHPADFLGAGLVVRVGEAGPGEVGGKENLLPEVEPGVDGKDTRHVNHADLRKMPHHVLA